MVDQGLDVTAHAHAAAPSPRFLEVWPPNDTAESVLGTDPHQTTITNLRWGINEAVRLRMQAGRPVPWHALGQTALLGCRRPMARSSARTQTSLRAHAIDALLWSVSIEVEGPPVLVIEVLSDSTNSLPISIGFEGIMATVFTSDGQRMLREGEVQETVSHQDATIARDLPSPSQGGWEGARPDSRPPPQPVPARRSLNSR